MKFKPLLKVILEEERKNFHGELESWESYEAKLTHEMVQLAENYHKRLQHACALIQEHFRI